MCRAGSVLIRRLRHAIFFPLWRQQCACIGTVCLVGNTALYPLFVARPTERPVWLIGQEARGDSIACIVLYQQSARATVLLCSKSSTVKKRERS